MSFDLGKFRYAVLLAMLILAFKLLSTTQLGTWEVPVIVFVNGNIMRLILLGLLLVEMILLITGIREFIALPLVSKILYIFSLLIVISITSFCFNEKIFSLSPLLSDIVYYSVYWGTLISVCITGFLTFYKK